MNALGIELEYDRVDEFSSLYVIYIVNSTFPGNRASGFPYMIYNCKYMYISIDLYVYMYISPRKFIYT